MNCKEIPTIIEDRLALYGHGQLQILGPQFGFDF